MFAAASKTRGSFAEYLAIDASSDIKHEYIGGIVHAMSGGSPEHARLAMAIGGELTAQLRGRRCAVYSSDLRVRVRATGLTTYPDVTVVCGNLELDPEDAHTVTNPAVIIEVTSPSTESYDRETKYAHYRRIESLRTYVIVSQEERLVEVFTRNTDDSWTLRDIREGEARLAEIDCVLNVDAIYRDPLAATPDAPRDGA
jgi:Uma2 family endonuclease